MLGILILAFLAGNLSYPKYFNQAASFLREKAHINVPDFWDIPFKLGLDLQGGTDLIYEADLSNIEIGERSQKMEQLRDTIERRVNIYGVTEPVIQIQGENRLIVELAGVKNIEEAVDMIGETPYLEFREILSEEERQKEKENIPEEQITAMIELIKEQTGRDATREEVLEMFTFNLTKSTELTGEYLKKAEVAIDPSTSEIQIKLKFDKEGSELFEKVTERNVGKPLAIFLDGMSIIDTDGDEKITANDFYAPVVQQKISGGEAVITGEMSMEKARKIAQRLNSGALPVKIGEPISQKIVGPTLGKISLEKSLFAGVCGFLVIIVFLIIFYRLPGFLASLSLGIYIALILSLFKLIPVTLTLAGIGGFILSIGMAVDANILIFSRMREELKEEKSFIVALEDGFRRSWPSIRDGNITTLIVALILFWFGTSFIKGFALTLSIGILVSMFSAIFITRNFLRAFAGTKLENIKWIWR